jgi:hypothetical protein
MAEREPLPCEVVKLIETLLPPGKSGRTALLAQIPQIYTVRDEPAAEWPSPDDLRLR